MPALTSFMLLSESPAIMLRPSQSGIWGKNRLTTSCEQLMEPLPTERMSLAMVCSNSMWALK